MRCPVLCGTSFSQWQRPPLHPMCRPSAGNNSSAAAHEGESGSRHFSSADCQQWAAASRKGAAMSRFFGHNIGHPRSRHPAALAHGNRQGSQSSTLGVIGPCAGVDLAGGGWIVRLAPLGREWEQSGTRSKAGAQISRCGWRRSRGRWPCSPGLRPALSLIVHTNPESNF